MWRNFGWTAVLATWTIFLILNSGLAGEWTSSNPRIDNEHTSHEAHRKATSPDFDRETIGDPTLRYAKEIFNSHDRSSAYKWAVSRELKNMDIEDFNGLEEGIAMSDATATPQHSHGRDRRNARLIAKRAAAEDMWLPRIIILEKLRNTRYHKSAPSTRASSPTSQEQRVAPRKRKRKARTIYTFPSGREETTAVKRDTRVKDEEGESRRRRGSERAFGRENRAVAFLLDEFTKRPTSEPDGFIRQFENSGTSKSATPENTESEYTAEKRERNRKKGDSRRIPELTKDSANELIYVTGNGGSPTAEATFPNCASSRETQSRENVEIVSGGTGGAIARNSPYGRSAIDARVTLISDREVPKACGEENADGVEKTTGPRCRSAKDERAKSRKAHGESSVAETYKRRGGRHSEVGFKVNTDGSRAEDIGESFTQRAPSDNYLAGNGIGFAERSHLRREERALRTVRGTPVSRREYHYSLIYDVGTTIDGRPAASLGETRARGETTWMNVNADANNGTHDVLEIVRDVLPANSSGEQIDETELDRTDTSARISVTQRRNPMHVRHVKSSRDRERRRTTDVVAQVRAAARIAPRNVSVRSSWIAKFEYAFEREAHGRLKYSQKFGAPGIGPGPSRVVGETADVSSKIDTAPQKASAESISPDASIIADNSIGARKINGRELSRGELTDESVVENVGVIMNRGRGDRGDAPKGFGFHARGSVFRDTEEYRRYKRRETRSASRTSTSTERDSETRRAPGAIRTATSFRLTANPSISTIETSAADRRSANAGKFLTAVGTSPSTRHRHLGRERRSTVPMGNDYERYTSTPARMDSVSLERPSINDPEISTVETAPESPIETLDRSTAVTKIDNFAIPKKARATAEATVRVPGATGARVLGAPSIEPINSREGHGRFANESASIVDLLPQRSSNPSRDVFENDTTTENAGESSSSDTALLDQWPVKHSAVVEGDLVLGGLMMVHEREDTITCGPVMPQGGVQALEAMLYTLDMLNDRGIVPGVKIGAHILDDCDKDTYGLEMAVDFIKGSISNIDGAEYHCNKTAVRKIISGVVGAASSVTSIQVANLLRLFRIPQVSFFSTSPELSNKQRFEYFTRTIPSDHYQVKAMVDIVLKMGWSYVSIIYEESNYGIKAFEELEELLGKYNICIAVKEKLVKDSGVAEEIAYDNIVLKLLTKPRAKGCIIFGSDQEVAGVMRAVRRCNATGAFSWIGSDGWSARGLVSNGNEPEVEGTLSVQPQANSVKGFEEYFLNLTVENNRRNPWFVEFWEDHFKCRYPNASQTPYNKKYSKSCTTKERLTKQDTAFENQLQFVSDAVMAFAYAFRDMHHDLCQGKTGLCDAMKPTNGTKLLQYLRKVDFEGLSGDKFRFDKNGDGPARYNIIHFKQTEPGKYKWVRVGKYLEGELRLNMSEIQFKLGHLQPPESVCSLPCEVGQAKKYVEGERCCWHCFNCTQYQIRHPKDETRCMQCHQGTVPDETHSTCRDIPEEFLRPESPWAIGAMSFSATGIFVTLFVCGVFVKHNDTPVVRASGRELSYVLLVGILLCYLVTFTLVLRPTNFVCAIQRFAAGFCFTVVYAALLTKTNRIARIFNDGRQSAKRPSFISPRSQLIICSMLVFVQILINVVWVVIDPARAMHHYPTLEDNLLVCNSYIDASYMIAFAYPIILIVVCTVYAVLTRKIPEAFNESKHIGFAMYTTCVIWFAFVPLYFGTGTNLALRITSMSVTISLSASVMVVCLFSPKLYIILIRPERNVRPNIKAGRPNLTKSSAITATNPSSMTVTATAVLTAATCDQNKAIRKHIASTMDCSTQSEYYEMELKDQKNGMPLTTCASRSTQTANNEKESATVATSNKESPDVIASASSKESKSNMTTTKQLNSVRIGNGPLSQSDVSL